MCKRERERSVTYLRMNMMYRWGIVGGSAADNRHKIYSLRFKI
jgi:hypothetical protein